jgi:uncharacterized protein YjbI with pentapeptide repeats
MTPDPCAIMCEVSDFELQRRWWTPEGQALAAAFVSNLQRGRKMKEPVGFGLHEGFIDARGLSLRGEATGAGAGPQEAFVVEVRGARLQHVDLSGAELSGLRLFDCSLVDLRLERVRLPDFRVWRSLFERIDFEGADLSAAILGPWLNGKGNSYRHVDFSGADLRGILCPAATFTDSVFEGTRLDGVDFQSSSFTRCRFAGELRDVIFWDRGFETGKPDPNRMDDVDFRDATLPWVEFRHLNLDRVWLPDGPEHVVLKPYREVLTCAANKLPVEDRAGHALISHRRRWWGPKQRVGVIHEEQLAESADPARLRQILEDCSRQALDRD